MNVPTSLAGLTVLLLLLSGLAAWVLLRTSKEEQELTLRLASVSSNGAPKVAIAPSITRRDATKKMDWRDTLAGIFGFSLAMRDQYSIGWPWVVISALVAGRIAVAMGAGVFGMLAWCSSRSLRSRSAGRCSRRW